jgi:phospholipid transport system substrate-binding protein
MQNHINQKRSNHGARILAMALTFLLTFAASAAEEAPDALVKRVSQEVLDTAKSDKSIQGGDIKHVVELVESKVFPYVDFQRATAMAAGRYWRDASPEQQQKLANEFRRLLVYTYSGALTKVKDQQIKFKPFRSTPTDADVQVNSLVMQPRGEPIELDYRLAKTPSGWKIYDMNIFGAWLIETYKANFSEEIRKAGIDGLIKTLAEKNNRLANAPAREAENPQSSK